MAISNYTLSRIANLLKQDITNAKISKIVMISNQDYLFFLYSKAQEGLIISLDPINPLVLVSTSYFPVISESKNFVTSLKKYFEGGTIIDFEKLPNDKILIFTIRKMTQNYQIITNKLVINLIPRQTNAIILDNDNRIIDAQRKTSLDDPYPIYPNMHYTFSKNVDNPINENDTLEDIKKKTIKTVYNEFAYRMEKGESIKSILDEIKNEENFYVHKQDIVSLKLKSIPESKPISYKEIPNLFLQKEEEKYKKNHYDTIYHVVSHKLKGLRKKMINLEQDYKKAEEKKNYVDIGNLLYVYQEEYVKGMEEIEIEGMKIKLNPTLNLSENASYYFKQYQKSKTALEQIRIQQELTKEKIEYFEKQEIAMKYANPQDMEDIIQELKNDSYLPKDKVGYKNNKKKIVQKIYTPRTIYSQDGTKIQFGISSYQNDYLTFTLAKKDNYFLHVKDHPGPHVIIYSNNPSKETILFACEIALFYASLSEGEVYLADKKDVKKIPGKLGKVSMNRYETITLNSIRDSSKDLFSKINTIK